MKHTSRRKNAKRKYKRLVAALAGAAVVSTAMLPGLPIATADAARNTAVASPAPETGARNQDRTQQYDRNNNRDKDREQAAKPQRVVGSPVDAVKKAASSYGFDARRDTFTLQWQSSNEAIVQVATAKGKTFKVRLNVRNNAWRVDSVQETDSGRTNQSGDPVNVVKNNAATFGFDARRDVFTLLSTSGSKATVQVRTSGQTFKVDLEKSGSRWIIATIRGIGDSRYPATFRPASLFGYRSDSYTSPALSTQKTLYTSNEYSGWSWNRSSYPANMKVGVLLSKPVSATAAGIPDIIVNKVASVKFDRQLVLYAHIGSVAEKGYGIGIEKVVQTGNNLTVTVRTKSPLDDHRLSPTKTNDIIPLDRSALNFNNPIQIKFVDNKGATLSTYSFVKR